MRSLLKKQSSLIVSHANWRKDLALPVHPDQANNLMRKLSLRQTTEVPKRLRMKNFEFKTITNRREPLKKLQIQDVRNEAPEWPKGHEESRTTSNASDVVFSEVPPL